jgi:hypothetical protein
MILLSLDTGEWIGAATLFITIALPLIALVFKSGALFERMGHVKNAVDEMKPDVKLIPVVRERVDILWSSRVVHAGSPVMLTKRGEEILKNSKIEEFTTDYYQKILDEVKEKKFENPYQVQEGLIAIVTNYKNDPLCKNKLENAAFITGTDVDTVLLVAAINIRDKIIADLGMKVEDVDKFDPHKSTDGNSKIQEG